MATYNETTVRAVEITDNPHIEKIDRSTLAGDIEKYWVGVETSNVGLQHLLLIRGRLWLKKPEYEAFERYDVGWIEYHGVYPNQLNCWIYPAIPGPRLDHRPARVELPSHAEFTEEEEAKIYRTFDNWRNGEGKDFMDRQDRWFRERPWYEMHGLSPEEAVNRFHQLGW